MRAHFPEQRLVIEPNPFGNLNFSTFRTSCFHSLERRCFLLEYRKTHFPGLYCLKEKNGKIANFGPKQWTNPLRKIAIFDFLIPVSIKQSTT